MNKDATFNQKSRQQVVSNASPSTSAGPEGAAIAAPDYGIDTIDSSVIQTMPAHENNTGLPGQLKAGVENLSGLAMDDVRVHYNSSKPMQLSALAYTQGTDIHVASGQERHLPHEAWHVVQQKQGRVKSMFLLKGEKVNDDVGLEREASVMGKRAMHVSPSSIERSHLRVVREISNHNSANVGEVAQMIKEFFVPDEEEPHIHVHDGGITFTDIGHAHKYLVRGDKTMDANVAELRRELVARGDDRSLKLNRWIKNHILR